MLQVWQRRTQLEMVLFFCQLYYLSDGLNFVQEFRPPVQQYETISDQLQLLTLCLPLTAY